MQDINNIIKEVLLEHYTEASEAQIDNLVNQIADQAMLETLAKVVQIMEENKFAKLSEVKEMLQNGELEKFDDFILEYNKDKKDEDKIDFFKILGELANQIIEETIV